MLVFTSSKIVLYFFFFIFQLDSISNEINYCDPNICKSGKEHIMCKFQSDESSQDCISLERTIKSESDKQRILDKINSRRDKVAAGEIRSLRAAENMLKLDWNDELAVFAQRWADQCIHHSIPDVKDTCRDLNNSSVGQNIATIYGDAPGLTPIALVDLWYIELLNVNASIISRYQSSTTAGIESYDAFTQLIWAETRQVGCGAVKFKERITKAGDMRTVYRLVCNFAPAGNQVGKTVYADGVPCSRCSSGGGCNSVYKALCDQFPVTFESNITYINNGTKTNPDNRKNYFSKSLPNKTSDSSNGIKSLLAPDIDYDSSTAYDYFSELLNFTTKSNVLPIENTTLCKDILLVDELLELLKKKLSNDQTFREYLLNTKATQNGNTGGTFTDPSIIDIVSHVYSKEESTTTTITTENIHINSTLLVNLVEAVIFRNNDKIPTSESPDYNAQTFSDVSPVKIKPELAEVRVNPDFTGHYFFPEEDNDQPSDIKIDTYYDSSNISVSDVALEIEDLKRNKGTKDFLEEILESDFITETITKSVDNDFSSGISNGNNKMVKKEISEIQNSKERVKRHVDNLLPELNLFKLEKRRPITSFISYEHLLKKLATDISLLRLNKRFHCAHNDARRNTFNIFLLLIFCLCTL